MCDYVEGLFIPNSQARLESLSVVALEISPGHDIEVREQTTMSR